MASYYVYDHDPSMTRREAERIVQDVVRHNPYIRGEPSIAYARGRSRHTLRGYRQEVYVMPAEANRMDRDHHQIDHRAAQSSSKYYMLETHSWVFEWMFDIFCVQLNQCIRDRCKISLFRLQSKLFFTPKLPPSHFRRKVCRF